MDLLRPRRFPDLHAEGADSQSAPIELIDEGRHGLAAQRRVPVFQIKVTDGLWLMNKAALLQLEHFNKSNALSWALTMGLFATPVVYSDREWNQIVGESYYIQLGQGRPIRVDGAGGQGLSDRGGQPGPAKGRNLPGLLSDERRRRGRSQPLAQSGLSKQRDFSITQEVLRAYGDAVKDTMKQVLWAIAAARQDGVVDRCIGAGRVRHRGLQQRAGRREEAARSGNRSRKR